MKKWTVLKYVVKYLEKSGLLNKSVSKTIDNVAKEHKDGFLGMLMANLDPSLFGKMLTGKEKIPEQGFIRADEVTIRPGQDF